MSSSYSTFGNTNSFHQPSRRAFGSSVSGWTNNDSNNSSSPFGQPSSNTFGSSVFGQMNNASSNTSPFGSPIGPTTSQSSQHSSSFQTTQPTFVNNVFGSSTPFGASSQPAFGMNRIPASGSSSNFGFTISSSPSFSFSSTPAFSQSISPFGTPLALGVQDTTRTFGSRDFYFGQPAFGGERRKPAYSSTAEIGGGDGTHPAGKLGSISAMPFYEGKSHEMLRWEDYQIGDKGTSVAGPTPTQLSHLCSIFPQTQPTVGSNLSGSVAVLDASSQPAFSVTSTPSHGSSFIGFGSSSTPSINLPSAPSSATGFGSSFSFPPVSLGSTPPSATGFGAPTLLSTPISATSHGASSTRSFSYRSTPAFRSSSCTGCGAPSALSFGLQSTPSAATGFGASTTPSFSSRSTPAFGSSSTTGFGTSSTPFSSLQSNPFSATDSGASGLFSSTTPFSFAFGTTPSPLGDQNYLSGARATAPTDINGRSGAHPAVGKLGSISAMPVYKDKSHEELRWEDYQQGDYGCTVFEKKAGLFGSMYGQTQPVIVSGLFGSSTPFGASSQPMLGAIRNPFRSTSTPGCVSSTPSFGIAWTPACGGPTSAFYRSPFNETFSPFVQQRGGSRVATYTPTTEIDCGNGKPEIDEASRSKQRKKNIESLRMAIEVEREVEKRMSQRHIDFLTSIIEKIDNLNI